MQPILRLVAAAVLALMPMLWASPSSAGTPKDTLVQAWAIDDIISLDPAEIFEFTAAEIAGNSYDRLIGYDVNDVSKIFGVIAESWTLSDDGKTLHFKIHEGRKFASGNPMTAADVVFSLQRAVILDKSPAFILDQFGLSKDNVKDKIRQTGDYTFDFEMDKAYAPTFVLYCMTATVASVVDEKLVMEHEADGDLGYNWLKTHYAGSGPFMIKDWRANEVVVLERNPNYWGPAPAMARAIYRHIPEPATERLLLEKGDVDVARRLGPEEIKAVSANPDIKIQTGPKGTIYYLGLNQKNQYLSKPEVRQALKYLVDYQTIADTILNGTVVVHQAFLPLGFLGALEGQSLRARRRKGQGAAEGSGARKRLRCHHGHPQHHRHHRHGRGDPADFCAGRHQAGAHPRRRQADADQVPRPQPRHLHRPLGPRLSGPQHQCRYVCAQRRQLRQRQGQAARLAQCLGHPGNEQDGGGRGAGA